MIYFDNINDAFAPIPVDPHLVNGIHQRVNGTTVINQVAHRDVITSTPFFEVCYAIGSAMETKEKDPATAANDAESNSR